MAGKSELQYAGEYLIEKCSILTVSGTELDIIPLVEAINLYEDIYSMTLSGDIAIKDTNNLVTNALGEITWLAKQHYRIKARQLGQLASGWTMIREAR